LFAAEIFNSKANSTQLNRVEFLDFVVKFTIGILQRSHHQPQSVN